MNIELDEPTNTLLGERVGVIHIGTDSIRIPGALISNTEINYGAKIAETYKLNFRYQNEVHEIKKWYGMHKIAKIFGSQEERANHVEWIKTEVGRAHSLSKSVLSMYTPLIPPGNALNSGLIRSFVELQIDAGLAVVNIPDSPAITLDKMSTIIADMAKLISKSDKTAFYLLPINNDPYEFRDRIDMAKNNVKGITAAITSPNADMKVHFANFNTLSELRSNPNIVRVLSNMDRTIDRSHQGAFYPQSFLVSDLYSSKLGFPPKNSSSSSSSTPIYKYLDERSMGFMSFQQYVDEIGKTLNCDCPVCVDNKIDDISVEYSKEMISALRVHEAHVVYRYNEQIRAMIISDKLKEFIGQKKFALETIQSTYLSNLSMKQTIL